MFGQPGAEKGGYVWCHFDKPTTKHGNFAYDCLRLRCALDMCTQNW